MTPCLRARRGVGRVAERGRVGVRRQRGVPLAAQVLQVAVQLGDARVRRRPRSATREGADERVGRREPVGPLDGEHDVAAPAPGRRARCRARAPCSTSPRRGEHVDGGAQQLGRAAPAGRGGRTRRRAGVARYAAASLGAGSRKMPASPIGASSGGEVGAAELGEQAGRHVRQVGGQREQLALGARRRRRGPPRRGSRTARRRVRAAGRRASRGRSARRAAPPRPPAARRAASRRSTARSRRSLRGGGVEPERVDVGRRDGEVARRDPGDLAGRPQPGDAQRRRPPARQHEVQARREVQHERLEELTQRVVRRRRRRRR